MDFGVEFVWLQEFTARPIQKNPRHPPRFQNLRKLFDTDGFVTFLRHEYAVTQESPPIQMNDFPFRSGAYMRNIHDDEFARIHHQIDAKPPPLVVGLDVASLVTNNETSEVLPTPFMQRSSKFQKCALVLNPCASRRGPEYGAQHEETDIYKPHDPIKDQVRPVVTIRQSKDVPENTELPNNDPPQANAQAPLPERPKQQNSEVMNPRIINGDRRKDREYEEGDDQDGSSLLSG